MIYGYNDTYMFFFFFGGGGAQNFFKQRYNIKVNLDQLNTLEGIPTADRLSPEIIARTRIQSARIGSVMNVHHSVGILYTQ